ncbi:MAG: hypothetical protein JWO46_1973, partial [Nocardioidaceae bacterium]|nr:hypothetical protein [Nocardioidaceae bacterium]
MLVLVLVAGCGGHGGDKSLLGDGSSAPSATASASPSYVPPATPEQLLDDLAAAVRGHDRRRFMSLLGSDADFRGRQRRLFANLQRLPVAGLSFHQDQTGRVTRTLALGHLDEHDEVAPAGFTVGTENGRIVAVPDPSHPATDPWDLTDVRAASDSRALVVTDVADAGMARGLLRSVALGIADVAPVVALPWTRTAVVYAFRDADVLASYARVPGATQEHLGALSYPLDDPDGQRTGTRIALLPGILDAPVAEQALIIRHELTHAAVGTADDASPTWLSEGVAEYVATLAVPRSKRRIATEAVRSAEAGTVVLPDSATFNGDDQALNYAVAWMACDYLAATQGRGVLVRLMKAMTTAG